MTPRMPSHDADLAPTFRDFVAALGAGDPRLVERFFLPGEQTLLGRGGGMVVGFAAIVEAVRADPLPAIAGLVQSHLREIGPDGTLITVTHRAPGGGRGLMTLLWENTAEGWRIASAHVDAPVPALDPRIWREAGTPLVAPQGSGVLDGLRLAVADVIGVAGHRSGLGSDAVLTEAATASVSAPVVEATLEAGAALVGLAQLDELALGTSGAGPVGMPLNIRAVDRIPGGAMSGVTAAVAHGQADIGLGTDSGGSLLVPASYQGLFGLRTTHGLVSTDGVTTVAPSLDAIGWVGRDLATLAAVADVLLPEAGHREPDEVLLARSLLELADPDVVRAIETITERWDSAVLPMRMIDLPRTTVEGWADTFRDTRQVEAAAQYGPWALAHQDDLGPEAGAVLRAGRAVGADRGDAVRRAQAAARAAVAELIGNGVLLVPTTATVAPTRDLGGAAGRRGRQRTSLLTGIAALGGLPTLTLPLATRRRLPVGLSLIGPVGGDHALVGLTRRLLAGGVPAFA
ncbi:amidase family protein [Raineyella fluvialis]|uniref:Amidase n=1 Tax=Raineyella fluvialis TaxID=2662261 RepID=A0A5Q2FK89_9ACTN|nr:amidase family protein [Raineyella fluvialis]QGF24756.1 amidase [Raineyella fluvialis]